MNGERVSNVDKYDNIYTIEQWMKKNRPDMEFEKVFPAVQDLHLFD